MGVRISACCCVRRDKLYTEEDEMLKDLNMRTLRMTEVQNLSRVTNKSLAPSQSCQTLGSVKDKLQLDQNAIESRVCTDIDEINREIHLFDHSQKKFSADNIDTYRCSSGGNAWSYSKIAEKLTTFLKIKNKQQQQQQINRKQQVIIIDKSPEKHNRNKVLESRLRIHKLMKELDLEMIHNDSYRAREIVKVGDKEYIMNSSPLKLGDFEQYDDEESRIQAQLRLSSCRNQSMIIGSLDTTSYTRHFPVFSTPASPVGRFGFHNLLEDQES